MANLNTNTQDHATLPCVDLPELSDAPREDLVLTVIFHPEDDLAGVLERVLGEVLLELLLDLADSAIVAALSGRPLGPPSIASLPEGLRVLTGAFVTLTVDGELNGCIGMIEGTEPLGQAVPRLAVSAAFDGAYQYTNLSLSIGFWH